MTKKELEAKTIAELRDIAGRMRISLSSRRKAEIIAELLRAARKAASAARKKAAPARKKTPSAGRKKAALKKTAPAVRKKAPSAKKKAPPAVKKAAVPVKKKAAPAVKKAVSAVGKRAAPPRKKAPPRAKKKAVSAVKEKAPVLRKMAVVPDAGVIGAALPSTPGRGEFVEPPAREDRLTAIVVDPRQVFVHWELTEDSAGKGVPVLRVHDITGVGIENALGFFDISVSTWAGSMYVGLLPEREFLFDIGVIGPRGGFKSLGSMVRIATPPEGPAEEKAVLPEKYFRFTPPGY